MGFYNLATQAPAYRQLTYGIVPSAPWTQQPSISQYELFQQYYSPFSEGSYDKKAFNRATTEAINHGLNIPKDVKKSMEELAKNGEKWFDSDGVLLEGLSEKEARKAIEHRKRVNQYYDKIKSKYVSPEQKRAKWAVINFIKNGFDTTAAGQYATLTDYASLANLWGGDVSGALKGRLYGSIASANEKAFYDKLTAPQKRAYLNQREQWVKSGLLKAARGQDLSNGLQAATDKDMLKYIQDNIQNWQYPFYGNNGYDDEYEISNPTYDQNTTQLYQLYGIPQSQSFKAWAPTDTIRISGFSISTPKEEVTKQSDSNGYRKQKKQEESTKQNETEMLSWKTLPDAKDFSGKKKIWARDVINAAEALAQQSEKNFTDIFEQGVVYDQDGNPYLRDLQGDMHKVTKSGNEYIFTNITDKTDHASVTMNKKGGKLLKCKLGALLKNSKESKKKKEQQNITTSYTEGSAENDIHLKNLRETKSNHLKTYKKTLDQINEREERLKYLDNIDKTGSSIFNQIDTFLKEDSNDAGYSYTGEIVELPGGYGDLSGRKVYHFDPEGFGEYYIYPDGTIIESKLTGSDLIDHDPWTNSGKENYTTMRLLAESIFKNNTKDWYGKPIKWKKYRATSRKQGGTLDYKHYFDFFNNKFN